MTKGSKAPADVAATDSAAAGAPAATPAPQTAVKSDANLDGANLDGDGDDKAGGSTGLVPVVMADGSIENFPIAEAEAGVAARDAWRKAHDDQAAAGGAVEGGKPLPDEPSPHMVRLAREIDLQMAGLL